MSGLQHKLNSKLVKGNTAYDLILRAWIDHKVEQMPDDLRNMLVRWTDVHRLLRQGEITEVTRDGEKVKQVRRFNNASLVEWLREKHDVSARTAYEDIRNAKRFFVVCEGRDELEYARGGAIEVGEQMMWAAFESGDFAAAAAFYKETNKIKGLHDMHVDVPDYSDFEPPSFIIADSASEVGFEEIPDKEALVQRILNEKRQAFIAAEAEDTEEEPDA